MKQQKSLAQIVEEYIDSGEAELPVFDRTALEIRKMIDAKVYDPQAVEKLVASDPALTGSLLRHANSSFFSAIEKVVTVRDAIVRLGVKQVAELVLLATQQQQYALRDPMLRELASQLWRHAVGCAIGAQWLARKLGMENQVQEAFLAGLMHDIGKLLLLRVLDGLLHSKQLKFRPSEKLVGQLLDSLHAEYGEKLMRQWNIPDSYAEIARCHHDRDYDETNNLLALIRLIDIACNRLGIGIRGKVELNVAASSEAQRLRASEVVLAELEIRLEDAMHLSA